VECADPDKRRDLQHGGTRSFVSAAGQRDDPRRPAGGGNGHSSERHLRRNPGGRALTLSSSICESIGETSILFDAPGTVIFTRTDGGFEGWITVDAGLVSTASFTIPAP